MDELAEVSILENRKTGKLGVISVSLLSRLVIEQATKSTEAGELFVKDGFALNEIQQISIEFLNILKIDNLWIMTALTRLKLSNNVIEKMENLDALVNLTELDLSFNRIRVIENIENLTRLETLLLYSNQICEIDGIDGSPGMTILNLGANKIATWDHVLYLRQFRKLRSFNITGNDCAQQEGYIDYIVAFVPRLVYLNYRMIEDSDRQVSQQKHLREIANLEEQEATEREEEMDRESERQRQDLLSQSYVEYLDADQLFQQMYANDRDGRDLSALNEETLAAFQEFEEKVTALCKELYDLGLREHQRRSQEIKLFEETINEGLNAVLDRARVMMDEILARKIDIVEKFGKILLTNESKKDNLDDFEDRDIDDGIRETVEKAQQMSDLFNELLINSWERLMDSETTLHEQISEINEIHKSNVEEMTTSFKDAARATFALMRDAESDYNYSMGNLGAAYADSFPDTSKMPERHFEICGDKNILGNSLAGSHDYHLQIIDAREDVMLTRLKSWLDGYTERLIRGENDRNRRQVLEISHFLEEQRQEFESVQSRFELGNDDAMDAWILT